MRLMGTEMVEIKSLLEAKQSAGEEWKGNGNKEKQQGSSGPIFKCPYTVAAVFYTLRVPSGRWEASP